jgi:hypothetical protein
MASTFGSQLAEQQAQQQQGRTTRTQRKQVFEQQEKSKYRFEQARKEAERLKTEEFIEKDVTTEYQEQYISEYRPRQFSAKEWDRMKGSTKEYWIKVMNSGYGIDYNIKKGRVVPHSYATRTASKTEKDPFTMEDYKFEYSKLSPDVQQFFVSPDEISAQQEQQKTVERENISSKLITWQNKIETIQQNKRDYEQWWSNQSSKYRHDQRNKERYKERLKDYELDLDEYRAMTNYLSGEKAKVEEGYSARDLINYAEDKADYDRRRWEAKDKAIGEFNKSLSQGSLDADLVKLGLNKEKLTYNQFVSAVDKYNKDVSYTNQLKQWAGKVGYDKLPAYAQEKINPSALEWQKKYPTEKLVFDKVGNVVGVTSNQFGGKTYTLEDYDKKVGEFNEYNTQLEENYKKQQENIATAQSFLKEKGFAEEVSFTPPKQSVLSKTWSGIKSLYLASPFGASLSVAETEQKEITALREQRVIDTFKPQLTVTGFQFPAYKFFTLPMAKSWEVMQYQRDLDYKAKEGEKLFKQLEDYSSQVSPEIKPYIETEGLRILREKGIQMQEQIDRKNVDKYGNVQETTTIKLTDPAFERKISQNMLEWEREREKEKATQNKIEKGIGIELSKEDAEFMFLTNQLSVEKYNRVKNQRGTANTFNTLTKQEEKEIEEYLFLSNEKNNYKGINGVTFGKVALGTRIASLKFLETYGLLKGVQFGVKGAVALYKYAGLPSKFYKSIELAEGTARVPRDFSALKTTAGVGLTGLYAFEKFQQYQTYSKTSEYGKEVFWLETAGELGAIEYTTGIGQKTFNKARNRIENWNLKTVKQADLSMKDFERSNKLLGYKEKVYMERYEGLKLSNPKSWLQKVQGYQKGQFTGRSYKFLPDELQAYYQYGGDVAIYPKGTKFKLLSATPRIPTTPTKIIKAEAFPYEDPSTHMNWFMKRNVAEYPVPKKSKLPISPKEKAFGYSATGEEWASTEFEPTTIKYTDKAGVIRTIKTEGAIQYVSGKGVSGGFLRIFKRGAYSQGVGKVATKPIIYADYIEKAKLNKAIKEIRGIDSAGRELKAYIYQKKALANELNIGGMKREVEGTIEITSRIPIRKSFAIKLEGWKVPIEEQAFGKIQDFSPNELKAIIKEMGSIKQLEGISLSSLPSKVSSYAGGYSVISYSKPSSAKERSSKTSEVLKSIISKISRISSGVSRTSKVSGISTSRISKLSELIKRSSGFEISRQSYLSTSDIPNPARSFKPSSIVTEKIREQRSRRKLKLTPEIAGLLPDFTARAIGLSPKEMSVKQALKEMQKIQTGFEVRTGGRIKGYKPIDEKSLLKGMMK